MTATDIAESKKLCLELNWKIYFVHAQYLSLKYTCTNIKVVSYTDYLASANVVFRLVMSYVIQQDGTLISKIREMFPVKPIS